METTIHPAATQHLPFFVTPPGETDVLMTATGIFLAIAVLAFGVFFFRLHSLPEQIAHKSGKLQAEVVAVLCLISLLTHMHIFWIIGLVLALVELPDFGTPLKRIAGSAEKLAGLSPGEGDVGVPHRDALHGRPVADAVEATRSIAEEPKQHGGGAVVPPIRPELAPVRARERAHV
jgi:hypothetical protein